MAYRGPHRCHLCGAEGVAACPSCGNGVCGEHTLAGRLRALEQPKAALVEALSRAAKRLGGPEVCETCLERDFAEAGPLVTIYRAGGAIEGAMLIEALQDAGYDARSPGTLSPSLLGGAPHIFAQPIEVPQGQAEAASELILALREGSEAALSREALESAEGPGEEGEGRSADDGHDDEDGAETSSRRGKLTLGLILAAIAAAAAALLG